MATPWDVKDLEVWDARIREKVQECGLDCYAQEFEICDHVQMLGYMAYSGMPSHYPHWSYGKSFEKLKTLYDYGVSGLPYEMVINSNPALAYLMRDNSPCCTSSPSRTCTGTTTSSRTTSTSGRPGRSS